MKKMLTRSMKRVLKEQLRSFPLKSHHDTLKKRQKGTKWQKGIISRPKSKTKPKRKRRRLLDKGVITRSVARRLSDQNLLTIDPTGVCSVKTIVRPQSERILNDDVLKHVLSHLSLKERVRSQRTCKQFYQVVQEMLKEQMALRIGNVNDYYGTCCDARHSTRDADIEDAIRKRFFYKYFYVNDVTASKESLAAILWKCPRVRCLELHNFQIDVETVKWLKWQITCLECLRVDELKYDLTARKWSQIGQTLGDTLIHLSIDGSSVKNDLTNLVQHLPLLKHFQLKRYELPLALLLKRLSSDVTRLSITECRELNVDSLRALINNKQIARNLLELEIQVSSQSSESEAKEVFALICRAFPSLRSLAFLSHFCPEVQLLQELSLLTTLELRFSRDQFLDLSSLQPLTSLRRLTIHGAFFMPRMLRLIGQKMPSVERLSLTNWAFVCQCPDNAFQLLDDCPDCDQSCCQSLLSLNLKHLLLEFLYSSDYIKPLILSLMTFEQLSKVTLVWYPVNTSINTINFVHALVTSGAAMARERPREPIRLRFEKTVIGLIDASKRWPKNLLIEAID